MNRLKKGDQVYIISGKDKGKLGTIAEIMKNDKILVDGINLAKKYGWVAKTDIKKAIEITYRDFVDKIS